MAKSGLDPAESVFILNLVACRPPGNRVPDREEIGSCAPRFQSLLRIAEPKALLLLGATAARLAGVQAITLGRGMETSVEILCYDRQVRSWPAVATYHPSYLLRVGGANQRAEVLADIGKAWRLANQ